MELKVWVEGIQRIVCGVTDKTTCQDVVYALAHATGKTGRFTLIERWRNNERLLAPQEHPLKVLHKWGEYSQDVQFILQRSSLDGGNKGVGPLSPPLQRSKFGPNPGGLGQPPPLQQQQQQQQQQPGQNTKARSVEPPPPAVWKPPPFTGVPTNGAVHGAMGQPGGPVRQVNGNNARLSPDSGRGSDKTGSDTSNSYGSEKETLKPAQTGTTSQSFGAPPSHPAMNGLPPSGYGVLRSASTSQMPFHQQQQSQIFRNQYESQQAYPGAWAESPYGFTKQISAPSLRQQPAGVIPPAYRPPPGMNPPPAPRNSSPADPPPYRAPPPPPGQGGARYRPPSPNSGRHQQQQQQQIVAVRPPHYSPPPTHRTPHLSRHPSRSSLSGTNSQNNKYTQQFQQLQLQKQQQQGGLPQRQQQRPFYQQGQVLPPTDYNELLNLVSSQQATLQSQQSEIRQFESEVSYLESVSPPSSSTASSNVGLPQPPAPPTGQKESNSQLELVLNEVRRLEESAMRNDEELRQMALEQQQNQRHLDQLMQLSPTECEDVEIRNEISQLKQRLAGTDQELQRTNHTLRRLGDEMRNMSLEKSRQREQELHQEMERLQAEIKTMQKSSEESANISQQLSKEVKDVEDQISQRKAEVEKLIKEMREANMESLAISPPEESKQFLDGPSKPGTARKMMGSPRQLENAVPTSKNPHGVWV